MFHYDSPSTPSGIQWLQQIMLSKVFTISLPILFKHPLRFSRFTDMELEPQFMTEHLLSTCYEYGLTLQGKEVGEGKPAASEGLMKDTGTGERERTQPGTRRWSGAWVLRDHLHHMGLYHPKCFLKIKDC